MCERELLQNSLESRDSDKEGRKEAREQGRMWG